MIEMLARRTRFLIIGALITIGILGVIVLDAPEPTKTVDVLMDDPDSLVGKSIAIRGEVTDGSIVNETLTFTLHGDNASVIVDFSQASVSNGLGDNRTVYAEGILRFENGTYVFEADIIKTSCPSKYEEQAEQ
ncbi:MAG: cytochrome c maturation protein CcmE [Candidatus Poseidoniaceae archaeon]|nr:cytochrome c maturation protein CcmE [Candidatus Poseidoniaceae archaeon]